MTTRRELGGPPGNAPCRPLLSLPGPPSAWPARQRIANRPPRSAPAPSPVEPPRRVAHDRAVVRIDCLLVVQHLSRPAASAQRPQQGPDRRQAAHAPLLEVGHDMPPEAPRVEGDGVVERGAIGALESAPLFLVVRTGVAEARTDVSQVGSGHHDDAPGARVDEGSYAIHESGDARVALRVAAARLLRAE